MNDAQSTVVGLKAQDCPGGGWNGMPKEMDPSKGGTGATVADCLKHEVCGCIYGDAVQHIERLRAALNTARRYVEAVALNTTDRKKKRNYYDCVAIIDAALEPKP